MQIIETLLFQIVDLIEIGLIFHLLNAKFASRRPCKWAPFLALLGVFGVTRLPILNTSALSSMGISLAYAALFFLYLLIFREGKWPHKLFWTLLSIAFLAVIVILFTAFLLLFFGLTRDQMLRQPPFVQLQFLIFAKLIQGVAFFLLARKKGDSRHMPASAVAPLSIIPVVSMGIVLVLLEVVLMLLEDRVTTQANKAATILMVLSALGLLAINVCVFVLYRKTADQSNRIVEQETLLQQNSLKKTHYNDIHLLYNEIRAWRHDYHNHLQAIKGLLVSSNYDSVQQYLDSIEGSVSKIESFVQSGNDLIDAIINAKISRAKAMKINVDADVAIPPAIKMEAMDLCALMGNLLDNAIEACGRITDEDIRRFITLDVSAVKGQLGIEIRNSAAKVNHVAGRYLTVKEKHAHGIGLQQIDNIVEKYQGYVNRQYAQSIFETVVSLPVCG